MEERRHSPNRAEADAAQPAASATAKGAMERSPPIDIRRATRADLDGLVALDARITGRAKPEYWDDVFDRYAARRPDQRFFLVAVPAQGPQAGSIVGYIIGEIRAWEFGSEPCGWIFGFAVDPQLRLRGIGERLFHDITGRMRAAGIDTIRTMVSRDNRLVMAFFRSEGMRAGPYIQLEMELEP
ncbi:MAG: hypothetical protein Kow0058_12260 [Roseovarius sp.]